MEARDGEEDGLQIVVAVGAFADDGETEIDFGVREDFHAYTVSIKERCTLLKTTMPRARSTSMKAAL